MVYCPRDKNGSGGHNPIMTDDWKKRLEGLIEAKGHNMKSLSLEAGLGETYVRDILKRSREPGIEKLQALARVLDVPLMAILSPAIIPVVGHVGAGGEWFLNGSENGAIPAPEYATPQTVAVKIRGDSMGSFLNGWYALYDDIRNPPTEDLIGEPCVVWTADGRAMVKVLRRGSYPGVWTLYSGVGDPIEDAKIIAAAKVKGFERG